MAVQSTTGHTGIYVNRHEYGVATITILKPDGTCGIFMMPKSNIVIWMGMTKYKVSDNVLKFTAQSVPSGDRKFRPPGPDDDKYVEAVLEPGRKYTQGKGIFDFVSSNLKFWEKEGNHWTDIGEARQLDSFVEKDFDFAHEIKLIMIACFNKYGNNMGW